MTNTVSKTVSDETLNCIIQIESGGRPNIRASTSSATGLGQFLDATWMATVRRHRPDLLKGRSQAQVLALRTDPSLAVELLARFTEDNQQIVGMNSTGGDLYLAHFLGAGAAHAVFRANPNTPIINLVGAGPVNANKSIMLGKTAGQVRAWAAKRMHESDGHSWVAKYYKPPVAPQALLDEPAEPVADEPTAEPTAEDIPDTQDEPAAPTAVIPVDAPPAVIEQKVQESAARDAEPTPSWLKRKWKGVTTSITSFLGIGGAAIFDWRIVAILMGAIFVGAVCIVIFMGPGDVRAWVRKQVA